MPIIERATLIRSAVARKRVRVAFSLIGRSRDSGSAERIDFGTVWSINASSDSAPIASSIASLSRAEGPIWRAMNSLLLSRAEYGMRLALIRRLLDLVPRGLDRIAYKLSANVL